MLVNCLLVSQVLMLIFCTQKRTRHDSGDSVGYDVGQDGDGSPSRGIMARAAGYVTHLKVSRFYVLRRFGYFCAFLPRVLHLFVV